MPTGLSQRLVYLRKEKGLSQKEACAALGLSQALLSHYERGIRECGLDFLVRAADFYGVSCDYLLGRTMEKNTAQIEIAEPASEKSLHGAVTTALLKRLFSNSLSVILDLCGRCASKELSQGMSNYITLQIYKCFRMLYDGAQGREGLLLLDGKASPSAVDSAAYLCEMRINMALKDKKSAYAQGLASLSQEGLKEDFPALYSSLINVLHSADTLCQKQSRT